MAVFLFVLMKGHEMHKFDSLVVVVGGEPLASTEVIAKGMKAQHASVIKLVRKHSEVLWAWVFFLGD